jgi:hypothetical protein
MNITSHDLYALVKSKIYAALTQEPTIDEWGNEVNAVTVKDLAAIANQIMRMMDYEARQEKAEESTRPKVASIPALPALRK